MASRRTMRARSWSATTGSIPAGASQLLTTAQGPKKRRTTSLRTLALARASSRRWRINLRLKLADLRAPWSQLLPLQSARSRTGAISVTGLRSGPWRAHELSAQEQPCSAAHQSKLTEVLQWSTVVDGTRVIANGA